MKEGFPPQEPSARIASRVAELTPSLLASGRQSTCSSPPARGAAHCAAGGGRAATAAAREPSAAAQPTARAWPAAGELLTSGQRERLAGPGKEQLWAGQAEGSWLMGY